VQPKSESALGRGACNLEIPAAVTGMIILNKNTYANTTWCGSAFIVPNHFYSKVKNEPQLYIRTPSGTNIKVSECTPLLVADDLVALYPKQPYVPTRNCKLRAPENEETYLCVWPSVDAKLMSCAQADATSLGTYNPYSEDGNCCGGVWSVTPSMNLVGWHNFGASDHNGFIPVSADIIHRIASREVFQPSPL